MSTSESQKRAVAKHDKANYEYCTVKVKKGKKQIIVNHAKLQGKSLNGFINDAIDEQIQRDRSKNKVKEL